MKLAIGLITIASVYAQPTPRFEVASAKPVSVEAFSTRPTLTPGRIRWTTQLCYLVTYAYASSYWDVSGPKCGAIYAIEATFTPGATDDEIRQMLRTLLADRFQLQFHRITKQVEGYALVAGKGTRKVSEAGTSEEPYPKTYIAISGGDQGVLTVTGARASMAQLAASLQRSLRMPMWDKTGLAGHYDFTFRQARFRPRPLGEPLPPHTSRDRKGAVASLKRTAPYTRTAPPAQSPARTP